MTHKNKDLQENDIPIFIEQLEEDKILLNPTEDYTLNKLDTRVDILKENVKNLKKIKKQQEKLGKLEEKRLEILREIECEIEKEKKSKHKYEKKKKK